MSEKQIWSVFKCCECGRYVHKATRKIVPKPNYGIVMSHGYCDDCKEEAMKEISIVATEERLKRLLRLRPVPPALSERIRRRTLDRQQREGRRRAGHLEVCS